MKKMMVFGLGLLLSASVYSQGLPGSEILLFDIKDSKSGVVKLANGKNISQYAGYDSQPRFSQSGEQIHYIRFVDGQTDIYTYHLKDGRTEVQMPTAESEYSPNTDHQNGALSVVQVDANGDQYLVFMDKDKPAKDQVWRHSDLKQVGYFGWTDGDDAWSFVLNDAGGGDLYFQKAGAAATKLSANVGRSFIRSPDGKAMHYVDKNNTPWQIIARNNGNAEPIKVMDLPMGVEDFTLDNQGRYWAGRDNTLFLSTDQKRWSIVAEFTDPKLGGISRLTTNPAADKIAIVFAEIPEAE